MRASYDHVREPLVALIAGGNSEGYVASALNRQRVPTPSGRGRWHSGNVRRACEVLGLELPRYKPAVH